MSDLDEAIKKAKRKIRAEEDEIAALDKEAAGYWEVMLKAGAQLKGADASHVVSAMYDAYFATKRKMQRIELALEGKRKILTALNDASTLADGRKAAAKEITREKDELKKLKKEAINLAVDSMDLALKGNKEGSRQKSHEATQKLKEASRIEQQIAGKQEIVDLF